MSRALNSTHNTSQGIRKMLLLRLLLLLLLMKIERVSQNAHSTWAQEYYPLLHLNGPILVNGRQVFRGRDTRIIYADGRLAIKTQKTSNGQVTVKEIETEFLSRWICIPFPRSRRGQSWIKTRVYSPLPPPLLSEPSADCTYGWPAGNVVVSFPSSTKRLYCYNST